METILREIEEALKAQLHFLAVSVALAVPDICSALEAPDGRATGARYEAWFNANLSAQYPFMTGADCYRLRCGVIHQGRFGHRSMQYGRVIFVLNAPGIHQNILNDALQLSAEQFCHDVIVAVRQWFTAKKGDPHIVTNLPYLVVLRPGGFPPYVGGMPVIG
jgi:hypothetical protein